MMSSCRNRTAVYAHSRRDAERSQWQALDAHADGVARLAASFARPFGSSEWAALLGEIHDMGKARRSFQSYLAHANGLDDAGYDGSDHAHSGAGACWAAKCRRSATGGCRAPRGRVN